MTKLYGIPIDQVLRRIQREWLLRKLKFINRKLEIVEAYAKGWAWRALFEAAKLTARLALRFSVYCGGGIRRASIVIDPWSEWGAKVNFEADRTYVKLAAKKWTGAEQTIATSLLPLNGVQQ